MPSPLAPLVPKVSHEDVFCGGYEPLLGTNYLLELYLKDNKEASIEDGVVLLEAFEKQLETIRDRIKQLLEERSFSFDLSDASVGNIPAQINFIETEYRLFLEDKAKKIADSLSDSLPDFIAKKIIEATIEATSKDGLELRLLDLIMANILETLQSTLGMRKKLALIEEEQWESVWPTA